LGEPADPDHRERRRQLLAVAGTGWFAGGLCSCEQQCRGFRLVQSADRRRSFELDHLEPEHRAERVLDVEYWPIGWRRDSGSLEDTARYSTERASDSVKTLSVEREALRVEDSQRFSLFRAFCLA